MSEFTAPTPEFGTLPEHLTAFNEAVSAVDQHNQQFSMGNLMARALIDNIQDQERAQELVEAGANQEEAEQTVAFVGDDKPAFSEEEQMARSIVGVTNAPVLEATGLALSPLRKSSTMFGPRGEESVGEVRLRVADGSKFANFLLAVNPEDCGEEFRENTTRVARSVIAEATHAITTDTDEHVVMETLAYAKGMVAGLENIGLVDSPVTEKLRSLYEHAQQGDVKEYVKADSIGLFNEPGEQGFGPSRWHRDATAESLTSYWERVLDVVKEAKANPRAKGLFTQLLQSSVSSLDFAKSDWAKLKADGYGGGGDYGKDFEKVFETVGLELSLIASPDEA